MEPTSHPLSSASSPYFRLFVDLPTIVVYSDYLSSELISTLVGCARALRVLLAVG
jgi:hypothetical protein